MEITENEGSSTLEPCLAPVLLFDYSHGAPGEAGGSKFLYSIPRRQQLMARGFDDFISHINWVTSRGWVLTLHSGSRDAFLRDPFSSRRVHLPPDRENLLASSSETMCVLSHTPMDPNCVVLVIHFTETVLCYCRPGGSQWFRYEYRPKLIHDDRTAVIRAMKTLTAVRGKFYMDLTEYHTMGTLEFSPNPSLASAPAAARPWPTGCNYRYTCLVESCGELFMVQFYTSLLTHPRILRVEVDKLDLSRSAWVKAEQLGSNRVFFVCLEQFGASMPADEVGLKANCIFFSNSDDKGLYVYDMEQGTTTLHNPGQAIPDSMEPILLMPAS